MEIIILLILLFFCFCVIGVVALIVMALVRWVWKPPAPSPRVVPPPADDLAAFERQLIRFYREGKVNDEVYEQLMARIRAEREPVVKPPPIVVNGC